MRKVLVVQTLAEAVAQSNKRTETVACVTPAREEVSAKVAIVMPVCNEASSIESTITEIKEKVMRFLPNSSLLIFEDGSTDNTNLVLSDLSRKYAWLRLSTSPGRSSRKGYSKAVRDALTSVNETEYDFVLFMDSDGQYDPCDFFKLWKVMADRSSNTPKSSLSALRRSIVMGRRVNRTEPPYRIILSTGLMIIERVLFGPGCQDITSAFRLMHTSAAKSLASRVRFSGQNFWLEFTARASEEGYEFCEVPITYRRRAFTAVESKSVDNRMGSSCSKGSNIYDFKKMPKIVGNELAAVARTWLEYKGRKKKATRWY